MPTIEEFVQGRSPLTAAQIYRLRELVADWQLLSDLSFADLILWVPIRKDMKSWPTGYVAIAHIRPMTAATVFAHDVLVKKLDGEKDPISIKPYRALKLFEIQSLRKWEIFSLKKRQLLFSMKVK